MPRSEIYYFLGLEFKGELVLCACLGVLWGAGCGDRQRRVIR